jgi:ElaB/YqjD/DUF883 family membrane-anchored ribosome-binding protein
MSPSVSDGRNVHASRMRGDNQGARSNFLAKAFNRRPQQTMSTSTTTGDETADQLRREMAMVRRELNADIKGVTAQAKELTDWRKYVKHAPWISIGIAAAAGFMVVPRKLDLETVDLNTIAKLAKQHRIVVESQPKAAAKAGLGSTLFGLISTTVLRAAIGIGTQKITELMSSQQSHQTDSPKLKRERTR